MHHYKDNWQKANWIMWSKCDLRIDTASFAIICSPTGNGNLTPKPFGCLTSATIVATGDSGLNTFIADTNDPVHGLIRLDFQSLTDEESFAALAQMAETSNSGRFPGGGGNGGEKRRSSMGMGRRSSIGLSRMGDSVSEALKAQIFERHPSVCPLVYSGAELYGPDPQGDQGSEVLLAHGAAVLLDSQESVRVGTYEMLFYDESYAAPMLRLPVGPRMRLERQKEASPDVGGRLSMGTRRSSIGLSGRASLGGLNGPSNFFNLVVPGGGPWGLSFDLEVDAAGFERDLLVRQRLVAVSLKTSRSWRTVEELQDELVEMRRRGFFATMRRLLFQAFIFISISFAVYVGVLYLREPERHPTEHAVAAVDDVGGAVLAAGAWAADFGMATCTLFVRAIPAADLEKCVGMAEAQEARSCAAGLVGISPLSFSSSPWD